MHASPFPVKTVAYVMDAYCGWCWGFSARLAEFEAANRHRVRFTAISGGLFTGERAGPLAAYPHIPAANQRIAQMTGATFGAAYQRLLAQGSMVMDSAGAAAGYAALRELAPERAIDWAHQLQQAFYRDGRSLSAPATIAAIATAAGHDAGVVKRLFADGTAEALAQADFALARRLGVHSYPTLLLIDGDRVHPLPATGSTLADMNASLDALLN